MERTSQDRATPSPPEYISERPAKGAADSPDAERERELDEDLKDTFPASDPVPPKHVD